MSAAEARDARQLLIFLDQGIGFAIYFFDGNFDLDFPPGAAAGLSGAHVYLSNLDPQIVPFWNWMMGGAAYAAILSVKTGGEQRQTHEVQNGVTNVTSAETLMRGFVPRGEISAFEEGILLFPTSNGSQPSTPLALQ
jgi:hypothetical protein